MIFEKYFDSSRLFILTHNSHLCKTVGMRNMPVWDDTYKRKERHLQLKAQA